MLSLAGTWRLARLALRRDRIRLAAWVVGLAVLLFAFAAEMAAGYPTPAERMTAATLIANSPAVLMIRGLAMNASEGGLAVGAEVVIIGALAALMSILTVVRHTRENEERGRAELLGSAVVGRHAALSAALIVTVGANLVLAALIAGLLVARGLPVEGSLAVGAADAAAGISFAAIAAVTAQLSASARGAKALAAAALGIAYLLRGMGDTLGTVRADGTTVISAWPTWLSPLGWAEQLRPFDTNDWRVLGLPAGLFVAGIALAFALAARRDIGRGMLPEGRGPATAPPGLLSPLGLAWRLQRGLLLGWAVALVVAAGAIGSLGQQASELADSPTVAAMMARLGATGATFVDTFFAALMALVGAIAAAYPLQALLQLRAEEANGHLEPVLATAASRRAWIASHLAIALAGTLVILTLAGLSAGIAYGLAAGDIEQVGRLTAAALVQAPAVLVIGGLVVAAFGIVPRRAELVSWLVFGAALVLGPLGEWLDLPQAALNLSPLSHVPALPAAELTLAPLAWLLAIAAVLTVVGVTSFTRRDLAP